MKQDIFIETKNVAAFRKGINNLTSRDRYQPGFMVVQGESGRGKSLAAINWHAVNGGIFLRVWEGWTQHAFLQALAYEVTGGHVHGAHNCKRLIVEHLQQNPVPIIVDEADRLEIKRLEDLRDIHEATGVAVVLIGEEGFFPKLAARQRIYSRVAETVIFNPIQADDVILYGHQAANLKIAPDAAKALIKASGGSFRMVHNFMLKLESYAKVNNAKEIDGQALAGLNLKGGQA